MTLVVRDEEDVLAANLDYHLAQGVDFVLVTDHGSRDATPEILARYVERGVARVFHEDGESFDQGGWVTRMARLAATEHGADWVLNTDADEFWWPLAGTLKDMLAAVPARYGQLAAPRHNFVPRPGEGPFWERMTIREAASRNLIGGELEPNAIHRAHPAVRVDHGNHWVRTPELVAAPRIPLVEVLHFPARSYEQFERKVRQQGRGYGALPDRDPDVGRDQLTMHAVHERGELADWFAGATIDDERVETGLATGELVEDRRLADFIAASFHHEAPEAARRLAVRNLADAAFASAARAEAAEQAGAQLGRQRDEALRELELLRGSRLFRWTRRLRTLYYRTRRNL